YAEEGIEHAGGDGDSRDVIDKCKEKILANVAHSSSAQLACPDDAAQVAFDQRHARAFYRHVRARAHRYAHVSLREGGRVVDSISRHRHDSPFSLQALHHFALLFWQYFGLNFI